jgi:hypothetical protein
MESMTLALPEANYSLWKNPMPVREMFGEMIDRLKYLFQTSAQTGNPVYWC